MRERGYGRLLVLAVVLGLGGCSGGPDAGVGLGNGSSGDLAGPNGAIGQQLADYQILDLTTGQASSAAAVTDLFTNRAYITTQMVFRRVHAGTGTDYFLGVFELTQGQWQQLAGGSTPWTQVPTGVVPAAPNGTDASRLPAYNLSYTLVTSTLAAFNKTARAQLSLPTLTQWQTADAAGSAGPWSWGADPAGSTSYANLLRSNLPPLNQASQPGLAVVGSLLPNAFGFYDMEGNVWEWTDPGPHLCGGSWLDGVAQARIDNVAGTDTCVVTTQTQQALIGARLVLSP